MILVSCIFVGILSLLLFITGICSICFEDIELGVISIFFSVVFAVVAIFCGDIYFKNQQFVYCPNCHYQYQVYEQYDYCPQCNTKLANKCAIKNYRTKQSKSVHIVVVKLTPE